MTTLDEGAEQKVYYSIDMLKTQQHISKKFVEHKREGVYELKTEYEGNIYRVLFCFDEGHVVILFNGFQKKTQKTPKNEIALAEKLRKEYFDEKNRK